MVTVNGMKPITAWVVNYSRRSRLHLDPACEGLGEDRDLDELELIEFDSLLSLARDPDRLPCRMCALSGVLLDLLRSPKQRGDRWEWVSVASVPLNRLGDGAAEVSTTGADRLRLVAGAVGWSMYDSPVGPVMVGRAPASIAQLIEENLAVLRMPARTKRPFDLPAGVPLSEVLAGAWSLARSRPVSSTDADVITLAAALAA